MLQKLYDIKFGPTKGILIHQNLWRPCNYMFVFHNDWWWLLIWWSLLTVLLPIEGHNYLPISICCSVGESWRTGWHNQEKPWSMALADIVTQLQSHIECPVCLETLSSPKLLTCGHRFCKDCLEKIERDGCIKCPLCGAITRNTTNQLAGDTLAANLKDEIDNIWDTMHNQEDTCIAHPDVLASVRCLTCQSSLCNECYNKHGGISDDVNHTVIEYDSSVLCDQHGKDRVYVCEDCEKTVCSTCLIKECQGHRHTTIWSAVEGYFKMRGEAETKPETIQENFCDYKQEMLDVFELTTIEIQEHSDWVIDIIQRDTQLLIDSVNELRSHGLDILEATKAAADLLADFSIIELPACQNEISFEVIPQSNDFTKSKSTLREKRLLLN